MKPAKNGVTIYLDSELHRILAQKAADSNCTVSHLINEAVRLMFAEDAEDVSVFEERADEPDLCFEDVLEDLKQRAKI
jgi:hypothetical protein